MSQQVATAKVVVDDPITSNGGRNSAGISRILVGFIFLWAFLDRTSASATPRPSRTPGSSAPVTATPPPAS